MCVCVCVCARARARKDCPPLKNSIRPTGSAKCSKIRNVECVGTVGGRAFQRFLRFSFYCTLRGRLSGLSFRGGQYFRTIQTGRLYECAILLLEEEESEEEKVEEITPHLPH